MKYGKVGLCKRVRIYDADIGSLTPLDEQRDIREDEPNLPSVMRPGLNRPGGWNVVEDYLVVGHGGTRYEIKSQKRAHRNIV